MKRRVEAGFSMSPSKLSFAKRNFSEGTTPKVISLLENYGVGRIKATRFSSSLYIDDSTLFLLNIAFIFYLSCSTLVQFKVQESTWVLGLTY